MDKQIVSNRTMEYYSALKRSKALTRATTHVNLKNVLLSEGNQTQKVNQRVIPLIWNVQNRQIQRQKPDRWLPRAGETGSGFLMGSGFYSQAAAARRCESIKRHWIARFRIDNFTLCEFHFKF